MNTDTYDFDNAVEAAENIVELSENYDNVDTGNVAASLRNALHIYQEELYEGPLSLLQDPSLKYGGEVEDGVESAETALDLVEEAQKEDDYGKKELEEDTKSLMLAREHLVHRPAEEFDAKSALEG